MPAATAGWHQAGFIWFLVRQCVLLHKADDSHCYRAVIDGFVYHFKLLFKLFSSPLSFITDKIFLMALEERHPLHLDWGEGVLCNSQFSANDVWIHSVFLNASQMQRRQHHQRHVH